MYEILITGRMSYYDFRIALERVKADIDEIDTESLKDKSEFIGAEIESMMDYYSENFPLNQQGLRDFWEVLVIKLKNLLGLLDEFPHYITDPVKRLRKFFQKELHDLDPYRNNTRRNRSRSRNRSGSRNRNGNRN